MLLEIFPCRWARNTYSILGGKPFWVDPFDSSVQHIFIDDNIRQTDEDTIVHPKVRKYLKTCLLQKSRLFKSSSWWYILP